MDSKKDATENLGSSRCSTMQHAIDRVKRHYAPHEPNTPRVPLSEMLDDMKALCDLAIQEYERDTQADFNQWKHTSFGRKCLYVVGEDRTYQCFLAGRNWRPPKHS
jgi:hypothetical protein